MSPAPLDASGGPPTAGEYRLLSFPPHDQLFRQVVLRQIREIRADTRLVRSARRRLRQRYPDADLHRQQHVIVQGVPIEIWFAYRDGRRSASLPPKAWWDGRGTARAIVDGSGRVNGMNAAFRSLLDVPAASPSIARLSSLVPSELCEEFRSLAGWLPGQAVVASSATVRLPQGRRLEVEYHVDMNAAGPGRHGLAVRSIAERDRADERAALAASSLGSVSAAVREELHRSATRKALGRGERLTASVIGDEWAVLVVAGVVRLYLSNDGLEPTVLYGRHGSLLGTHLAPPDQANPLGLETVTPSVVLQLSAQRIEQLIDSDPGFARAVMIEGRVLLHDLVLSFASRSSSNLPERLAREILLLADLQPNDVLLPVTEQQLADGIGSIRESVGRTIAGFRNRGWLATTRHGVIVLEADALRRMAGVDIAFAQ